MLAPWRLQSRRAADRRAAAEDATRKLCTPSGRPRAVRTRSEIEASVQRCGRTPSQMIGVILIPLRVDCRVGVHHAISVVLSLRPSGSGNGTAAAISGHNCSSSEEPFAVAVLVLNREEEETAPLRQSIHACGVHGEKTALRLTRQDHASLVDRLSKGSPARPADAAKSWEPADEDGRWCPPVWNADHLCSSSGSSSRISQRTACFPCRVHARRSSNRAALTAYASHPCNDRSS
eukprot:SAG11_NODE_47_length_20431_cov_7.472752_23_plen_234_part_00